MFGGVSSYCFMKNHMPKKISRDKKRLVALGIPVFFFALLFFFHAWIGLMAWRLARMPHVSLFFNQQAGHAFEIGNYYFNVYRDGVYDLDKAAHYFKRALAMDPAVPGAWHQLARIDFLRGDLSNALTKINTQIELHGNSSIASYYVRGLINGFMGNFGDAERDFLAFLSWNTKSWAAYNDLAWIYFSQGNYRDTETTAREGLALNPGNPWLLNSLGVALLNQEKKREAYAILVIALKESETLTLSDWHTAYPGNDPSLGDIGLKKMQQVIRRNLALAEAYILNTN